MSLPQHVNPKTDERRARAPYNFVPLPEVIVPAQQPLPDRDRYYHDRYTGIIHCKLTTKTPLYTRAALEGREYGNRQAKDKDEFFYVDPDTKEPVIPGSSLRGMLRNLVEIITYSKPLPVTDRQLFFRTVDDTSVGKMYNARTRDAILGGFFRTDGVYHWIEPCLVGRIPYEGGSNRLFGQRTLEGQPPNQTPVWSLQHKPVWVKLHQNAMSAPTRFWPVERISQTEVGDWKQGVLVLSGWAPKKKGEFVFVPREGGRVSVSDELLDRFHDDDQITQWQENAFPWGQPPGAKRGKKGWLRDGEPVFYLEENGKLTFFGRAAKFRLPYVNSPRDLLPDYGFNSDEAFANLVDMADAIFGRVHHKATENKQIAGRIYVGNAWVASVPETGLWAAPEGGRLPKILGGPKPTTIQHYLTQDHLEDGKELWHYDSMGRTTLRGHKLYWHKQADLSQDAWAEPEGTIAGTQHTGRIRPLAVGVTFAFDIRFENLTMAELGALIWVLRVGGLPSQRLKIGMGKPYGLGTVAVTYDLQLSSRGDRYRNALAEWQVAPASADGESFREAFEQMVWDALPDTAKVDAKNFRSLPRVAELMTLLHWPGPDSSATTYMALEGFEGRPVLPTPSEVMHLAPPLKEMSPEEDIVGSEVEAVILRLEGSTAVVRVNDEEVHLPYVEMPEPNLDQKRCQRRYPAGTVLRVKVLDRTKKGKLRITAKGVRQE